MRKRAPSADAEFEYPSPPEYIEPSIRREAAAWQGSDEFDALVRLEEMTGLEAEVGGRAHDLLLIGERILPVDQAPAVLDKVICAQRDQQREGGGDDGDAPDRPFARALPGPQHDA